MTKALLDWIAGELSVADAVAQLIDPDDEMGGRILDEIVATRAKRLAARTTRISSSAYKAAEMMQTAKADSGEWVSVAYDEESPAVMYYGERYHVGNYGHVLSAADAAVELERSIEEWTRGK